MASPETINSPLLNFACFDTTAQDYHFARYCQKEMGTSLRIQSQLSYSQQVFRSLKSVPILWVDSEGDTRWNEAAEREMLRFLLEKQTLQVTSLDQIISERVSRQLLIIHQHEAGFYSRFNCFIEQFGQTLYSPSMALLSHRPFHVSGSGKEDFKGEGILRYIQPVSTCAQVDRQPKMRPLLKRLHGNLAETTKVHDIKDLLYENQRQVKSRFFWLSDIWAYGYEHVPHRRWLFDIDRPLTVLNFSLSIGDLLNHTNEHIYHASSWTTSGLKDWRDRNPPLGYPTKLLGGDSNTFTWKDYAFMSFLRYMFVLYFHHFSSRIYTAVHLLAEHWSSYLMDKSGQTLNDMAAIFIRRGDKMPEDSFWLKYKRWRNISFYVRSLVDEEQRRKRYFSSVFIMTDDLLVMKSIQDYADEKSHGNAELYARRHLRGRNILYNVFAPQACFNPFIRIGFDQFLVSLEFIVQYSQFTVSHTDSNVGRYLPQIIYARRQSNDSIYSYSLIRNAPDSL